MIKRLMSRRKEKRKRKRRKRSVEAVGEVVLVDIKKQVCYDFGLL